MNNDSIARFASALANNPQLMARAESLGADMDAIAAFAGELGYNISAEDLREYKDNANQLLQNRLQKVQQPAAPQSPGVQAFFALTKLAETDESVAKQLEEIGTDAIDDLITYGAEKGFIFTAQDMAEVGKEILAPSDELSDEELEMVAGGTSLLAISVVGIFLGIGAVVAGSVVVGGGLGAAAGGAALGVLAVVKAIFS